ncbi:MAG: hypothetical protein RLZZ574_1157 [Cyanobacteriota bacterium]
MAGSDRSGISPGTDGQPNFSSVTEADLERERKALSLLTERFKEWQERGFIPSQEIEKGGDKTEEPIRTRGWTHWHHLFTPRQLLMHGLFLETFDRLYGNEPIYCTAACLSIGSAINRLARLCGVEIACNHLVPEDFAEFHWKSLTADERLYLKGVELEKHGEFRNGAYQELAKGFGVRDYNFLYAKTKSNETRFKTASEFKRTNLKGDGFDQTLVRHLLFAIHETVNKETVQEGLNYLKVEVPNYWSDRKRALEILRYLSRLEHIPHLAHWKKDAEAARVLAGAVENDHG